MVQRPLRQLVFLEASAGTGKTYQLAKRFLTLLLGKRFPHVSAKEILAVTFTNKAAGEMRERIISWLKEAALGRKERLKEISKWTGLPPQEVKKRAEEAVEEILRDFSLFRVGTIDSFIRKIALAGAYDLGLPPRFDIVSSGQEYHQLALDEVLFRDLPLAEEFVRDYVREFGGWGIRRSIYKRIKDLQEKRLIYGLDFQRISPEFLQEKKGELVALARRLLELLDGMLKTGARDALEGIMEGKFDSRHLKSEYFKKETIEEIVLKKHLSSLPPEAPNLWRKFRKTLGEYLYFWGVYLYSSERIFSLYEKFSAYLEEIKNRENIIFLEELNEIVHRRLKELNIPRIILNLAGEISHFLFDEFQDTVPLQWENLGLLIAEAFSSGPASLFVVGDRKQSIYRFRGGDPTLMDREGISQGFNLMEEEIAQASPLKYNRRSREKILEFVRNFFNPGTLEEFLKSLPKNSQVSPRSIKFLKEVYTGVGSSHEVPPKEEENRAGGYVEVRVIEGEDKEEIKEKVGKELIALVREILERFSPEDIMILVRKRDQAKMISGWFSGEGIPFVSQSSLSIRENPAVSQVVSLMKFLDSPLDDVAFVNFILGDVFLKSIRNRKEILSFLEEARKGTRTSPLYVLFRERFHQIWKEKFEELFSRASGFLPPYDLAVKIAETFEIEADTFMLKFFEVLWEREASGKNSLKDFLSYWEEADEEELAIEMPDVNAVRIMTIHKAKGLESPVIILPFAQLKIRAEETVDREKGYYLKLRKTEMKHLPVYIQEEKLALLDEVNNLYVGFTRAKDELYVLVPSYRGNLLSKFPFGRVFGDGSWRLGEKLSERKSESAKPHTFSSSFSLKWMDRIREDSLGQEVSFAGEEARRRGEAIHRALEMIGEKVPSPRELMEILKREGMEEIFPLVDRMLKENPDLFGEEVFREKEIVDREGRTYRMDRLVIDDEIRVFEFKTGDPEPQHREQLKNYLRLVKEAIPEKPVKGILLYLGTGRREEISWEER